MGVEKERGRSQKQIPLLDQCFDHRERLGRGQGGVCGGGGGMRKSGRSQKHGTIRPVL